MDSAHRDHGTETAPSAQCSEQTPEKAATMAITPIIGHKRTHSEVDSDGASADAPAPKQTTRAPPRVLLVHLSTLLSCKQAIIHAVRATVPQVLLDTDIPEFTDEDVLRAFSRSPMLSRFLYKLAGRKLTPNEEARLRDCYPRIYYQVGAPLLTLAPHAKEFLEAVKRRDDIALAVISSNPTEAVETLIKLGVGRFVDTVLPSLPAESTGSEEADALVFFRANWQHQVVPWFTRRSRVAAMTTTNSNGSTTIILDSDNDEDTPEINIKPLIPAQAMVVSCCLYDLCVAKAGGTQTCWIRKVGPDDDGAVHMSGAFGIVVEELDELMVKLFGEGDKDDNWNKGEGGKDMKEIEGDIKMEEGDKDKKAEEDKGKSEENKINGVGHMNKKIKEEDEDLVMGCVENVGGVDIQEGAVEKSPAEVKREDQLMEGAEQKEGGAVKAAGKEEQQASKVPDANGDQTTKTVDADGDVVAKAADTVRGQATESVDAGEDQAKQSAQVDEADINKVEVLE